MIRKATDSDISGIKALWEDSFDDPLNYIDFFYNNVAKTSDTYVFELDNIVVAMMTLIPCEFVYKDKSVKAMYIYGAATNKKFRRKGIMSSMLKYAEKYADSLGCALTVLVPGEKYLFRYYKDRGYSSDFNCRLISLKHAMVRRELESKAPIKIDSLTPAQIYELRERFLMDIPHIKWNAEQFRFILKDAKIYDEHVASYEGELGEAYAVFGLQKKRMFVKECLGTTIEAQQFILAQLIKKYDPSGVSVQLPIHSDLYRFDGELTMYGMAKPLSFNTNFKDMDAYMNFMLD